MTDREAIEKALKVLEDANSSSDLEASSAAASLRQALAQADQAHTDHPMRHWDRTCPACVAEPSNSISNFGESKAIAQPEQEQEQEQKPVGLVKDLFRLSAMEKLNVYGNTKVYLAAPPSKQEQEPKCCPECGCNFYGSYPFNYEVVEPQLHPKEVIKLALKAGFTKDAINVWLVSMEKLIAFAAPPSKSWVSLTDEEIDYLEDAIDPAMYRVFARRIEAKLKERNT